MIISLFSYIFTVFVHKVCHKYRTLIESSVDAKDSAGFNKLDHVIKLFCCVANYRRGFLCTLSVENLFYEAVLIDHRKNTNNFIGNATTC